MAKLAKKARIVREEERWAVDTFADAWTELVQALAGCTKEQSDDALAYASFESRLTKLLTEDIDEARAHRNNEPEDETPMVHGPNETDTDGVFVGCPERETVPNGNCGTASRMCTHIEGKGHAGPHVWSGWSID